MLPKPVSFSARCTFLIVVTLGLINSTTAKQNKPRQFPNLSFALPLLPGLLNSRSQGNFFGGSGKTVTKTLISTVSTVTVPSYRTCTASAAAQFLPCAGRKRRDITSEDDEPIQVTPVMKVIIGKTVISDPAAVAEILHLDHLPFQSQVYPVKNAKQDATTILHPSEDATTTEAVQFDETVSFDGATSDSTDSTVTTETPYDDSINNNNEELTTTESPLVEEEEKARVGFGGANPTVTSTIPVTHVVSTAVNIALSTLTIMYQGCSPPGPLPVVAPACV